MRTCKTLIIVAIETFCRILIFQAMFLGKTTHASASVTEFTLKNVSHKAQVKEQLIFSDEFDTFDHSIWKNEIAAGGGGNNEFQMYTANRNNSFVKDGKLHLKPTFTVDQYGEDFLTSGTLNLSGICTNDLNNGCFKQGTPQSIIPPIMSARVHTINTFSFKYGRIEVKAKVPRGDWLWPAIWLLPQKNVYGGWPVSGEIDVMEGRGNLKLIRNETGKPEVNIGVEQVGATLHFGPHGYNGWEHAHFEDNVSPSHSFDREFHIFELIWTPKYFKFMVDKKLLGTVDNTNSSFWNLGGFAGKGVENPWVNSTNPHMAPFDQEFYLIINLAVGGTNGYFPDTALNEGSAPKPWKNGISQGEGALQFWNNKAHWERTWSSPELVVDYVRVYSLNMTSEDRASATLMVLVLAIYQLINHFIGY